MTKIEEPEEGALPPPLQVSAPAPTINIRTAGRTTKNSLSAAQVNEEELIIKAETSGAQNEQVPNSIEENLASFVDTVLDEQPLAIAARQTKNSKKKKSRKTRSTVAAPAEPLPNEAEEDDLTYIPQDEPFVHLSDNEVDGEHSNETAASVSTSFVIKQEKLHAGYGDIPVETEETQNFDANQMVQIKCEINSETAATLNPPPIAAENIKKEKPDTASNKKGSSKKSKSSKSSKQKNLAANFAALARKIKKERTEKDQLGKNATVKASKKHTSSMTTAINPLAHIEKNPVTEDNNVVQAAKTINPLAHAAKKLKSSKKVKNPMARLKIIRSSNNVMKLKIKKETSSEQQAAPSDSEEQHIPMEPVQIKQEPIENEEYENQSNYLGLNPLSLFLRNSVDGSAKPSSSVNAAAEESTEPCSATKLPVITRVECIAESEVNYQDNEDEINSDQVADSEKEPLNEPLQHDNSSPVNNETLLEGENMDFEDSSSVSEPMQTEGSNENVSEENTCTGAETSGKISSENELMNTECSNENLIESLHKEPAPADESGLVAAEDMDIGKPLSDNEPMIMESNMKEMPQEESTCPGESLDSEITSPPENEPFCTDLISLHTNEDMTSEGNTTNEPLENTEEQEEEIINTEKDCYEQDTNTEKPLTESESFSGDAILQTFSENSKDCCVEQNDMEGGVNSTENGSLNENPLNGSVISKSDDLKESFEHNNIINFDTTTAANEPLSVEQNSGETLPISSCEHPALADNLNDCFSQDHTLAEQSPNGNNIVGQPEEAEKENELLRDDEKIE